MDLFNCLETTGFIIRNKLIESPVPVAERSKVKVFAADRLLGLRVRIPLGAWMFVLCVL